MYISIAPMINKKLFLKKYCYEVNVSEFRIDNNYKILQVICRLNNEDDSASKFIRIFFNLI